AAEDLFADLRGHVAEVQTYDAAFDDFFLVGRRECDLAAVPVTVEAVILHLDVNGLAVMGLEDFGHVLAVGEQTALCGGDTDGLDFDAVGGERGATDEGLAKLAEGVGGDLEIGEFVADGGDHIVAWATSP